MRSSRKGKIPSDLASLIDSLNDHAKRIGKLEKPGGADRGSTLEKVNDNIVELLLRVPTSQEQTYTYVCNFGDALPFESAILASQTITLSERRRVMIDGSVYIGMLVFTDGSGPFLDPRILVRIRLGVTNLADASTVYASSSVSTGAGYSSGVRAVSRRADRPAINEIATLDAGSYDIGLYVSVEVLDGTGGSVTFDTPKTIIEIMEKAP